MKELAIKIRHRCNTKEMWESANPLLEQGEIGIQIPSPGDADNPKARWFFKFGDGVNRWNKLPWAAAEGAVDETLEKEGFAADAKVTGDAIKELSDRIDIANYKQLTLTLTVENAARERTKNLSVTVKLTTKYSGAKPKNEEATVTAKIGQPYPEKKVPNFNNKSVTFTDLKLTTDFMKSKTPVINFGMTALEDKCVGNGNKEIPRTASATLTFKDYVYYGYSKEKEAHKLDDTTEFLKNLNHIQNFGVSVTRDETSPDSNGEYYYICCPYYYELKKLVGGEAAFNADYLGEGNFDYGDDIIIPYKFYRTKDIYKQPIAITFNVG